MWHHLHYRCYHIHSITTNLSIYDVTTTSGITSHPLYQTSHPLYLCHHNLSTDILPTFVWHHTHYMDYNICTLHNIISLLMSSHYCAYAITASIYETTSSMLGHIYTIHVTSQPLICVITLTLLRISHTLCMTSAQIMYGIFALYKTSHPRFMTSNHHFYDITPTIFDSISTVSVSSHPMYWWYHTNWIFEISSAIYGDIISIVYDITALNVCHHTNSFYDKTSFVYRTSHPLYV